MIYYLISAACFYLIVGVDYWLTWESPHPAWVKYGCCALWPIALVGFTLSDIVWGNEA